MDDQTGVELPALAAHVDAAVLVHHPETGEILAANEQAERLVGYDGVSLSGASVAAISATDAEFTDDRARDRIRAAADGDPQEFEWLNRRPDGDRYWVRVHLEAGRVDDRDVVVATVTDISEYKRRDRRMRLLYRVLRHNLRNEMNVVAGNAQALAAALEDSDHAIPDRVQERLATIEETAMDVSAVSDRVADVERTATADGDDRVERSLADTVAELTDDVREAHDAEHGAVDVAIADDCRIRVDDVFVDALEQLLENAVTHGTTGQAAGFESESDGDGGAVSVRAERVDDSSSVRILVDDDGPGIPDVETAILEPDTEATSLHHGSGLGLWIAKWAAEAHGGDLEFVDDGPGTTVKLEAPVAVGD